MELPVDCDVYFFCPSSTQNQHCLTNSHCAVVKQWQCRIIDRLTLNSKNEPPPFGSWCATGYGSTPEAALKDAQSCLVRLKNNVVTRSNLPKSGFSQFF